MEAWVGIEPTRHGFANRSLSHSSTTPCVYCNITPGTQKASGEVKKNRFFGFSDLILWPF